MGASKSDQVPADHSNTATGISCVTLYEHLPEDFQYYLQTTANQRSTRSHSFGMELKLENARLSVLNRHGLNAHYGITEVPVERGLRAIAIDVSVQDIEKTIKVLKENDITTRVIGPRHIVDNVDGQGAVIAFVQG